MTKAAKVYLTLYSIDSLSTANTYNDIENIAKSLNDSLDVYKRSNNVDINCSNDFFEYGNIGESLDDKLLDIVQNNWDYYQLALSEINNVVLPYVTNNNTEGMLAVINNQIAILPRHYSFILADTYNWPSVSPENHTTSWSHTLSLNSKFIADNHTNVQEFISWSKINYEYLDFHPNLENTLSTIQVGTYTDYKQLLSHGLNALNQSYHLISTEANQNQADLNIISHLTHQLGHQLNCSRQGRNKIPTVFNKPNSAEDETINCEYHLKIDTTDNRHPIPRGTGNPVRIYFGLKSYNEYERKQFKIAHIGKHL
ncbi:hypothetical protein J8M21_14510 [Pseudoalteromonas luteoviolacea]|uniref:hypothetical protein n=1 Tax=Pseudoalteromonas luteoviolacea TaxID=43657 RepID=UPI001B39DEF4|nr:hypothetical protein [Pseudoalteromonas luteoviolacea]MBQ4878422.1 hypothetical protein [Pseudoalteromonas luteoviolacea]MBQ4907577.1 hypothetical protein [Pseudoalteromonas luteoviolacea]